MTAIGAHWTLQSEPRLWQREAFNIWKINNKGVVSVVTGGGKTVFAQICMLAFLEQFPGARFIIVVPTITLLDQWYVSLQEDLNVPSDDIACYSGEEKPTKPSRVNLIVVNTAREIVSKLSLHTDSFLIVDECHRAGSPVNALALKGSYRATLGLSATPERDYDDGFLKYVEPILGKIIFNYDYTQAYHDKVICPFELINVHIDLLPTEQTEYDKLSRQIIIETRKQMDEEGHDERIKRLLQRRAAISATSPLRLPVAAKLVEKHRGTRSIIFHERVDAAEQLLKILIARKHNATIYHSGIGSAIRRDNLKLYRKGLFDILVCCRALDEGVNVPETAIAVIASSTASLRQRIQRLGRVLRPATGKDSATVYTIYATDQEERRLLQEARRLQGIISTSWNRVKN